MRALFALLVGLSVVACTGADGSDGTPDASITVLPPDAAIDAAPPPPDSFIAQGTTCAMKVPVVQLTYTCQFEWSQCTGTTVADRQVICSPRAAGQYRFALCDCYLGGVKGTQFISTTLCPSATWDLVQTNVNTQCGWDLEN